MLKTSSSRNCFVRSKNFYVYSTKQKYYFHFKFLIFYFISKIPIIFLYCCFNIFIPIPM